MSIASLTHIGSVPLLENGTNNPLFLSKIYQLCRKFNTELGLSGVMSYARGLYILTIEGSKTATKAFLYNEIIQELTDEYVIVSEKEESEASLTQSPLRVARSITNDPEYLAFLRKHIPAFDELDENTQKLIEEFLPKDVLEQQEEATTPANIPVEPEVMTQETISMNTGRVVLKAPVTEQKPAPAPTLPETPKETPDFSLYSIKLTKWPDFRKIKQDPFTIELCARLTAASHSYADLSTGIQLGNKANLDHLLGQLHGFGILQLTKLQPAQPAPATPIKKKQTGFYSKMKKMLGFG